jgi:hypothetical protein
MIRSWAALQGCSVCGWFANSPRGAWQRVGVDFRVEALLPAGKRLPAEYKARQSAEITCKFAGRI